MPNPIDFRSWVALRSRPTPHLSSNSPPRGASDFGVFWDLKNSESPWEMLNFHGKILESWCPERALREINESALVSAHECPQKKSQAFASSESCRPRLKKKKKNALEASQRFLLTQMSLSNTSEVFPSMVSRHLWGQDTPCQNWVIT